MKRIVLFLLTLTTSFFDVSAQSTPSGNPADFRVKTCLHSIGYSGLWRGSITNLDATAKKFLQYVDRFR